MSGTAVPTFPAPTAPAASRSEVHLRYLDYFRAVLVAKLNGLPEEELRSSRLPSGWTPLELLKHVTHVEARWLEWGFEGRDVGDPWGDRRGGRWHVAAEESLVGLISALEAQAVRSRAVVEAHALDELGSQGNGGTALRRPRSSVSCCTCCRNARHVGHLDVVRELIDGRVGEE